MERSRTIFAAILVGTLIAACGSSTAPSAASAVPSAVPSLVPSVAPSAPIINLPSLPTGWVRYEAPGAFTIGAPHPFDRMRGSMRNAPHLDEIASLVDWVETWNARVVGRAGNERAAEFARLHHLPGVAVSDAHSVLEIAVASTVVDGDPSTPAGLLAALATVTLAPGRASLLVRVLTPVAKIVQRTRGNGRVRRVDSGDSRRDATGAEMDR
jgi:hypothetical protein